MFETITEKQKRVYNFYKEYIKENGFSPSYSEVSAALKLAPSVIFSHVHNLEKKGYLMRNGNGSVGLTISKNKKIPVLGTIACGKPIEVTEFIEDEIEIPDSMLGYGSAGYALKARGDSMKGVGIFDGDLLIIRHQNVVNDGDIAVVVIHDGFDEKATLKQVFKKPDAMVLMPKNPAFTPIYAKNCEIRGKLVGVIRQF